VGHAIGGVFGELDVGGDLASRREGVYGSERAGELEAWEGIVVCGVWIRLRNDLWGKDAVEDATLRFVEFLVLVLAPSSALLRTLGVNAPSSS
jgi:hypothetical protein